MQKLFEYICEYNKFPKDYVSENKSITEVVNFLINSGNVNTKVKEHLFFRYACHNNNMELIKLLLARPETDPSDHNNDAIYIASKTQNVKLLKLLLDHPRTITPKDVLTKSILNGQSEIAKVLISHPKTNIYININKDIITAVRLKLPKMIKLLLDYPKLDLSVNDNETILTLVKLGETDLVNRILIHPNFDNKSYYMNYVSYMKSIDIFNISSYFGIDDTKILNKALEIAKGNFKPDIVDLLMAHIDAQTLSDGLSEDNVDLLTLNKL